MDLNSYLRDRKNSILRELMVEHAGRCKAVGNSFMEAGKALMSGSTEELNSRMKIIRTEERSADEVEARINKEISTSNIPPKLGEELAQFVRTLDRAAGACKRAVINLELLRDFKLPNTYVELFEKSTETIHQILIQMERGVQNISDIEVVTEVARLVDELETVIDQNYRKFKKGYFEIEKSFGSSAALILLDHALRDLEAAADFGEDSSEMLLALVRRT